MPSAESRQACYAAATRLLAQRAGAIRGRHACDLSDIRIVNLAKKSMKNCSPRRPREFRRGLAQDMDGFCL
jgi:hypothetical protein